MSRLLTTLREGGAQLARVAAGALREGEPLAGPLYAQIGIVNPCNYQCVFCWDQTDGTPDDVMAGYYEGHDRDAHMGAMMDWAVFEKAARGLAESGARRVKLVGRGEPTLHPRLLDMVRLGKKLGFKMGLTTNGSRLTGELAESLVSLGLDEMEISLNAASPATYDAIHRGGEGLFEKVVEGARSVVRARKGRESGPHLTLSFVVVRASLSELPEMARLAGEIGANAAAFRQIAPFPGAEHLPLREEDLGAARPLIDRAEAEAARRGVETNLAHYRAQLFGSETLDATAGQPCYAGYFFTVILADGSVHPCCQALRELGDLKRQSFAEVWGGEAYRTFRGEGLEPRADDIPGARCGECGLKVQNAALRAGRRGQGLGAWAGVLARWNRTFLDR